MKVVVGERTERYASYKMDFICCRQVLEHIQFPRDFLTSVRHSIGNRLGDEPNI